MSHADEKSPWGASLPVPDDVLKFYVKKSESVHMVSLDPSRYNFSNCKPQIGL